MFKKKPHANALWARPLVLFALVGLITWTALPARSSDVRMSECSTSEDCDDGLFCNGSENCENGACTGGAEPCTDGQTCNEEADICYGSGPNPGHS